MKKTFFIFYVLLIFHLNGFSQLPNESFSSPKKIQAERANELYLAIQNFNFVKNNEYFNDIVEGRTYLGYQFAPSLVYQPSEKIRIQAGVFFWKDFGNPDFTDIQPIFSAKFQTDSLAITLGNLEGALSHNLIEPLYDFENIINQRLENGLQIQYNRSRFGLDLWVDWQQMIYQNSPFQEIIFGGLNAYISPIKTNDFELRIPFQATIRHQGGQIDSSELPVRNTLNYAVGLWANWHNSATNPFLKNIQFDTYFVGFQGDTVNISNELISLSGQGVYSDLRFNTRWLDIMFSYWSAEDFSSAQGGSVYRSYNAVSQELVSPKRELLFLRLFKEWQIADDFTFIFRAEPYYDFQGQRTEFSTGVYMVYQPNFKLAKIKKKKD